MNTTNPPTFGLEKLIAIHRWMAEFEKKYHCKPAVEEISLAFGLSTSVVRYDLRHMSKLRMGWQPKLIREKTGKEITPTRSYILLPLEKADQVIKEYLQKEN